MIDYTAEIERFDSNGEKTGWSYVFIPQHIAEMIKADNRREIRVKGSIDGAAINGMCMMPVKEEGFILPLNKPLRKILRKEQGAIVRLELEHDVDFKIDIPDDLELCLADEPELLQEFMSRPKSHRNYFINWLNSAKTEPTRTKRLVMILNAMANQWDFGLMIRNGRPRE